MKTGSPKSYRVLIVDDHPMMRQGLSAQIDSEPDLEVCGEAEGVAEAARKVSELLPDLVIVDISLKDGHGIDLIKKILSRHPQMKILVNSMYEESVYAERALQAGARGYVNKRNAAETLLAAIHDVLVGRIHLSDEMTDRLILGRVGRAIEPGQCPVEGLSNRELEVFTLIGQGKTTGSIAKQLFLSTHTIDTYREKLKTKLNLSNGAELSRYATQWVLENG